MRRRSLPWLLGLLGALLFLYHPLLAGRVLAGRDAFQLFIPDASFLFDAARALDWPLWNPWQRLGQPFAATLQAQAFYPVRWVAMLGGTPARAVSLEQVLHAAVAATGAWRCARALGRTRWASALSGAAFGLGPLFTQLAIQQNVVSTAAWAGWVGAAALRLRRAPSGRAAAALAIALALAFLGGSPETLLWELVLAGVLLGRRRAPWHFGAVAGGVSLLLVGATLAPALEFILHSRRAAGLEPEPLAWSTPPLGLLATAWLNADLPRPEYWGGEQNFLPTVFVGTIVVALAGLGLARRQGRGLAWFGLSFAALSLGASFAPSRWLLSLPPLSHFRYPAKYLVAFAFAVAVLSALGLDAVSARARRGRPPQARWLRAFGLAAFAAAMAGVAWWQGVARAGGGAGLALGGCWGGLALLGWALPGRPLRAVKVRVAVFGAAALELAAADALFGQPFWREGARLEAPSPLAAAIGPSFKGRISTRPDGDARDAPGFVEGSRAALVPLRFVEEHLRAVEGYGAPEPLRVDEAFAAGGRAAFDLAGVEYFVRAGAAPFDDLEPVPTPLEAPRLYRARSAFPRAFVVHEAREVRDDEAAAALRGPSERL
ncbi:MAG: hypothetical protein INH37_23655, partial [Myxococcaceae bacterium]|nr:hypothetical protein [Myxococcaceae bacterium]